MENMTRKVAATMLTVEDVLAVTTAFALQSASRMCLQTTQGCCSMAWLWLLLSCGLNKVMEDTPVGLHPSCAIVADPGLR
jgi:hypothetical protein